VYISICGRLMPSHIFNNGFHTTHTNLLNSLFNISVVSMLCIIMNSLSQYPPKSEMAQEFVRFSIFSSSCFFLTAFYSFIVKQALIQFQKWIRGRTLHLAMFFCAFLFSAGCGFFMLLFYYLISLKLRHTVTFYDPIVPCFVLLPIGFGFYVGTYCYFVCKTT